MISEKQYKKALLIVEAYRKQLRENAVMRSFTEKDLTILSTSIGIESLTSKIVDEDFASDLQRKIEHFLGDSIRWVSLDDMGYISVTFGISRIEYIEQKHIDAVLSALNNA